MVKQWERHKQLPEQLRALNQDPAKLKVESLSGISIDHVLKICRMLISN